jgi:asparagine synthase (glutamine-hydrolysing)
LIQGISRTPWLSSVHPSGDIEYHKAPPHGQLCIDSHQFAEEFLRLYRKELLSFVEDHHERIYMLLSGGMDSRVMAATLETLKKSGEVQLPIIAVTWGIEDCRDVVYAHRIAEYLGWEWVHVPLDSESYWRNFEFGAIALGAEVDPKHLHRMDWFKNVPENSLVLAASYGDSVGRAEFSSVHLSQVQEMRPEDLNRLLLPKVYSEARNQLLNDIGALRRRHGHRSETGWREIERQAHYMRRHLCTVMNTINRWATLRQSFTTPDLFGFVWSLSPSVRKDDLYERLLERLDPTLLDVPWARTGRKYNVAGSISTDDLSKGFHRYGRWLRSDHSEAIAEHLFGGTLDNLGIFDMKQVQWLYREWLREHLDHDTRLCTQLSFLAALSIYAQSAGIEGQSPGSKEGFDLRQIALREQARWIQRVKRISRPLRHRKLR